MDPAIEIEGLTKRYGDITAVDGVSFDVRRGEIFGLLGPNGAGKTTTIRMLSGLARPSAGTARVLGHDIGRDITNVKGLIGVVPDISNLYSELSGYDNLIFMGQLYGVPRKLRRERALALLEEFGLYGRRKDRFSSYSRGMKRRLTIAAALMHDPEVLFLDEPTTGLDVISARELRALIAELNSKGKTIFLTTHYIEEADRLCSRVAIMVDGRIKAIDIPSSLKERSRGRAVLEVAFVGEGGEILGSLSRLKGVEKAVFHDERYRLQVSDPAEVIPGVIELARGSGHTLTHLSTATPTLEDVFVEITGLEVEVMKVDRLPGGAS